MLHPKPVPVSIDPHPLWLHKCLCLLQLDIIFFMFFFLFIWGATPTLAQGLFLTLLRSHSWWCARNDKNAVEGAWLGYVQEEHNCIVLYSSPGSDSCVFCASPDSTQRHSYWCSGSHEVQGQNPDLLHESRIYHSQTASPICNLRSFCLFACLFISFWGHTEYGPRALPGVIPEH